MHILIADDDTESIKILGRILTNKGFNIEIAVDSESALKMINNKNFDIVFLDQNMPGYNGIELAQCVKDKNQNTKVVLVTGYPRICDALLKIFSLDEFVQKPYFVKDIEDIIKKYSQS